MGRKKKPIVPYPTRFELKSLQRQPSTRAQILTTEDTLIWGEDDALPLRIANIVRDSPATTACISTISKFIKGERFSDREAMSLKIDKNGTTLWQLHCMLSDMLAMFSGFAVCFKFDVLGKITNAYPLSMETVRLKKPDDYGYISTIKSNPYFGTVEYRKDMTKEFPVFNKQEVLNQISEQGTYFPGQVYFYGKTKPLSRFYPVPDFWAAKNWIQIDAKIQEFHNQNLENGFFQSILMSAIGDPTAPSPDPSHWTTEIGEDGVKRKVSTKTVAEAFNEMMADTFSGASKAGNAFVTWSQNHDTAVKIQAFPTTSNADLFSALQDLTTKNITIATQVPGILANISEGVNLGSGGSEIQKAVELMQSRVSEEQSILEQFYNEILLPNLSSPFLNPVSIVNFNPITVDITIEDKFWDVLTDQEKRAFISKNISGIELQQMVPPDGELIQQGGQINSTLKDLGMADINRVQKIVSRFNLSKYDPSNPKSLTLEQAKQFLASYGFSEGQIDAWLITEEELEND